MIFDRWIQKSEDYASMAVVGDIEEPANFKEAKTSPQASLWMAAMEEEMESLLKNETWTLTTLPVEAGWRWQCPAIQGEPSGERFLPTPRHRL